MSSKLAKTRKAAREQSEPIHTPVMSFYDSLIVCRMSKMPHLTLFFTFRHLAIFKFVPGSLAIPGQVDG
jgi:hypothetical protein